MKLIDTHCHLYLEEFRDDIDAVIQRAMDQGVDQFFLPNIDSSSIEQMLLLEKKFPKACRPMMGLHPCSVKENYKEELAIVKDWLLKRKFTAVGEIGLDFYWDRNFDPQQYESFHQQMEWAKEFGLPIVIHSRESMNECIEAVKQHQDGKLIGIFHSFSGGMELAEKIIDLGFYLGIGGVITYKKSGLAETLSNIDLRHLVLETDSPYLTPVPFRGKRNESSYLKYIAERLAEAKGVSVTEVAGITSANAELIFNSK